VCVCIMIDHRLNSQPSGSIVDTARTHSKEYSGSAAGSRGRQANRQDDGAC
jgi:hypothetical protein